MNSWQFCVMRIMTDGRNSGRSLSADDYVSIASGIAVYDPQADQNVSDVLKRADEEMYENKTFIKSGKIC